MNQRTHSSPRRAAAPPQAPALWQQLDAVAQCLQAVLEGQSSRSVLARVAQPLRPGVQALLFQVLRQLGRAQALQKQLASRNPPPRVSALLNTALALAWDEAQAPYPPFTLVNQAVEAAKQGPARAQAGFVNACLRRFLRERDALVAATESQPQAVWNHPAWWIARLRKDHPDRWQDILRANNAQPPMTLRVNRHKTGRAQYQQALQAMEVQSLPVADSGLQLQQALPVQSLPGFDEGLASVQDAAAQLAAPLLLQGLEPPEGRALRVLDACAAPGGKTAHLLECAAPRTLEVTALEIDAERAARIGETLGRLQLQAQVLVADASRPAQWFDAQCGGQPFDAILLDAPCTASGIVRRHPDIRWLRRENDVRRTATLQARILDALWRTVAPGGRLLYVTCSVFPIEGTRQALEFLQRHPEAVRLDAPGQLLPVAVDATPGAQHDGFFYALFAKQS
jgi:16S rRNA (cytosine967-C5)-methyltransferase